MGGAAEKCGLFKASHDERHRNRSPRGLLVRAHLGYLCTPTKAKPRLLHLNESAPVFKSIGERNLENMKATQSWNYERYRPAVCGKDTIYLCRVVPLENQIELFWKSETADEFNVCWQKRDAMRHRKPNGYARSRQPFAI